MCTPWILGTQRPCLTPVRGFFDGEGKGSLRWDDGGVSSTIFERNFWMLKCCSVGKEETQNCSICQTGVTLTHRWHPLQHVDVYLFLSTSPLTNSSSPYTSSISSNRDPPWWYPLSSPSPSVVCLRVTLSSKFNSSSGLLIVLSWHTPPGEKQNSVLIFSTPDLQSLTDLTFPDLKTSRPRSVW